MPDETGCKSSSNESAKGDSSPGFKISERLRLEVEIIREQNSQDLSEPASEPKTS